MHYIGKIISEKIGVFSNATIIDVQILAIFIGKL